MEQELRDGGRIPEAGQWPETTVLVPVGATRTIEFVADNPGDWACHSHMTHHVMNQMGHGIPNMVGMDPRGLDQRMCKLLPAYMTMVSLSAQTPPPLSAFKTSHVKEGSPSRSLTVPAWGLETSDGEPTERGEGSFDSDIAWPWLVAAANCPGSGHRP